MYMELMMLRPDFLLKPWPLAAQGFFSRSTLYSFISGRTTGSIIWQIMPSATIMTGHWYLSAVSKATLMRSMLSLDGGGGEDDEVVVTVAAALGGLEVVALAGLDGAEAGAAAHDVHDDAGQLGAGYVGDALLLQGDAGGGGAGEDALAGAGSAVDHVDGADLALGLQEAAADFGHTLRHVLRDLGLRGYRGSRRSSGSRHGWRPQLWLRCPSSESMPYLVPPHSFSMRMTTSGTVRAQDAQAMQAVDVGHLRRMVALGVQLGLGELQYLFGHARTQSPQPLHSSSLMVNFTMLLPHFFIICSPCWFCLNQLYPAPRDPLRPKTSHLARPSGRAW